MKAQSHPSSAFIYSILKFLNESMANRVLAMFYYRKEDLKLCSAGLFIFGTQDDQYKTCPKQFVMAWWELT